VAGRSIVDPAKIAKVRQLIPIARTRLHARAARSRGASESAHEHSDYRRRRRSRPALRRRRTSCRAHRGALSHWGGRGRCRLSASSRDNPLSWTERRSAYLYRVRGRRAERRAPIFHAAGRPGGSAGDLARLADRERQARPPPFMPDLRTRLVAGLGEAHRPAAAARCWRR
jgi:hypothetical protein